MRDTTLNKRTSSKKDKINLNEVLKKYSYYWKLFLFSVAIALLSAFLYLQFATYSYEVSSTILINEEENGAGVASGISAFQDFGLLSGIKTSLDTEIGILKSKTLIEKVAKDLRLNTAYFIENEIANKEAYKNEIPLKVNFLVNDTLFNKFNTIISILIKSETNFDLFNSDGDKISEGDFGEKMSFGYGDLVVTPIAINNVEVGQTILIKIRPLEEIAISLKRRIEITQENPESNLLILKLQDPIKLKAREILDSLVSYYNKDVINYKKLIAKNTNEFINSRIDEVSIELTGLDQGVETYKTDNKLSNLGSEANIVLESNASLNKQIVELNSQIKLIDYVIDYMKTNKDDLIPANLGLLSDNMSQNTIKYNNLLLDRNRLLKGANNQNPIIVNLNDQITSLRESIDRSLINKRSSLRISLSGARGQESKLNSKLFATPKKEREIRDIQRQQEIIETLYLYLLQKREENSISSAVTAPFAKVIDRAYGSSVPVTPRKIIVLITSLMLGLLVPVLILIIQALFDNKIQTYEDIKSVVKAPLIGDIPNTKLYKGIISFEQKKRSHVAESFRLLRTNINHILSETKESKNIYITSTTIQEGKTFISINLAASFSLLNKKVLLVEANIRDPKIEGYLDMKDKKGLSHFLNDESLKVTDIVQYNERLNVDIILAGHTDEKSSELLSNGRFLDILSYGKQNYDYIIIDTPAVNVASDTLMLANYQADLFLYVIRANFLTERMLNIPKTLYKNKRLPNMNILLNNTNYKKMGYDNSYDYGEANLKKSWWRKII
tara:strand:+ start:3240 stop:5594 length:2355 start_codon:yes stop_codon:yes gene_type:complete